MQSVFYLKKYRCYTDTVIGRLLIGNNLYLEAADKDGNSTYCRFDANGLQILNSSLSVCNSLGDDGQADFTGDGFFVKPEDGVLVRGTSNGKTYEVAINPGANKIFDIHSNEKNFLYLDTKAAELVVNGNIHAKSLYLQEIGGENVIKYIDGKSKIDSPYLNVKGLNVNDNLKIDSNGILTTTGNIMSKGTITGSNIEGSIIKGAKIFAGKYTEQDIIDAPVGTIKGVTIEGSTIQSDTTIDVTTNLSVGENIYLHPTSDDFYNNGGIYFESKAPYQGISGKIAIVYKNDPDFDEISSDEPYFTLCSPNGGNIEITTGADKDNVGGDLLLRGENVRLGVPAGSDGKVFINNSEALTDLRFINKFLPGINQSISDLQASIRDLQRQIDSLKSPQV